MYTEIIMVLDRSGSMGCIQNDTIEGVNSFLKDQKDIEGKCKFTLWQFDDKHEVPFKAVDIQEMPYLNGTSYQPRGTTALHDAICMASKKTGDRLRRMKVANRPDNVMFVIMTDGHENDSIEYNQGDVDRIIKHQTDKYNWDFIFLGANQDAIETAKGFGISAGKSMTFAANAKGMKGMAESVSAYYTSVRSGTVASCDANFTQTDRDKQTDAGA